jgi:hypothetical protein
MKSSGFNLRQTNDILKKNGLSEISREDFRYVSFLGAGATGLSNFTKNAQYKKSLTPQINKISKMLGFDLKKDISDPVNVAAIKAKSNPFIADMIKNNPELAKWMNLTSKTEDLESGMTGGLREMFFRLKDASNDPIQKFAKGGLVGYKDGGKVKSWDLKDPSAPWNQGDFKKFNDYQTRKQYWAMSQPGSKEIVDAGKYVGYALPGVGAGLLAGDSATAFGKGDVAGGILNAAMAPAGIFGPLLGTLKPVQKFFGALMKPVAAVAKPLIKIATPAVQAASNAAMRTAFRLGTVGIEQGSKSAATYLPSFMKSSMGALNTNNLDSTQFVQPLPIQPRRRVDVAGTNMMRAVYGENTPTLYLNPPTKSRRKPPPPPEPKPNFLETIKNLAKDKASKLSNLNISKSIKKTVRDASTLIDAKRFDMQTRNVASVDVPWKELDAQLGRLATRVPNMKLGKGISLNIKGVTEPEEIADMFSFDDGYVPDEMWAGLKGVFVNTNAKLYKDSQVGNFSGVLMKESASTSSVKDNFKRDEWFSMQDIYIELEKQYRGKNIAQRATTQMMALLKNAGVRNVKMNAGLTDGGYAWARAGFKFDGRPEGLIQRMEKLKGIVGDKKFLELLDRLKTADVKDLPMPKEILGLKTPWRKYFSEEELLKQITLITHPVAVRGGNVNTNTTSLGELIMRGSNWQGVKELQGGQKLRKTIDVFAGSVSAFPKTIGAIGSKAINSIGSLPKNMVEKIKAAKQVTENRKVESVFNEVVKRMEKERGREFTPEEIKSMRLLPGVQSELARQQGFNKVIKNPAIMTRRSVDSVINMLRTNKTKTLFDTGHSRGSDDILMRKQLENEYLGMGPESEGLIYGYLVQKGLLKRPLLKPQKPIKVDGGTDFYNPFSQMTAHYGPVGIVMKNSSLRGASITKGDSLNTYLALGTTVPVPFKGKETASPFDPLQASRTIDRLPEYMEAQFLRYSPREDIESLYVQNKEHLKQLRAVVKELGLKIPVRMYNKKPVVQDFLETIKNARKERIRQRDEQDAIANFANGGMVRRYALGGFVMPRPEPVPPQFANGGMVKAATGGMIINGKLLGAFANGGIVPSKFAMGGYAMGTDTVPAMLTPGEFVIKKSAVDRIGTSTLNKINRYAEGGLVGGASAVAGDSVYNSNTYEINVNVSSNSNPDQIANAVMSKIRQIDNKRVRGSAFNG